MHKEDLDSWEHFKARIQEIQDEREATRKSQYLSVSDFLYRGQGSHAWPLHTTLERAQAQPSSMSKYFRLVAKARFQIESFTGLRWELEDYPYLSEWAAEYDNIFKALPGYEFQVYLRHHGFPSPLLDWTRSPYVAAYFAFAHQHAERVAVYVYWEYAGSGKSSSSDTPLIRSFGPYVRSHPRHFLQQSEYTIAARFVENEWWYTSHDKAFDAASTTQDKLWKFTIPVSEREKVLKILDAHNLNAFSLFQTDEALLSTIAVRELELSG